LVVFFPHIDSFSIFFSFFDSSQKSDGDDISFLSFFFGDYLFMKRRYELNFEQQTCKHSSFFMDRIDISHCFFDA